MLVKLVEQHLPGCLHAGISVIFLADRIIGGAVDVHPQEIAIILAVPSLQGDIAVGRIEIALRPISPEHPI